MERELYLTESFCAVREDRRLVEYIPIRPEDRTGQILMGKVNRMMPGLEAAFVDIGRKKDGFLPLKENSRSFTGGALRSGERVLVQIRREETGSKGAYLSRDLSLPGSCLILMPLNRHIGVSARVLEEEERARMLRMGQELAGGQFGLVMREAALGKGKEELEGELAGLLRQWDNLRQGEMPSWGPAEELIRDYGPRGIDRITREGPLPPDLERQRKEAENRRIRLPHGGNIVIDRCEALTVIDINSASDGGDGSRRATALRTNLEACGEIAVQARLRNLAGILILDFIDMEDPEDRERVRQELEACFRRDRMKTVLHGYTSLGLMEMTRKRSRATWPEQQCT